MSKRASIVAVCAVLVGSAALAPASATDDPVQTLSVYGLNSSLVEVGIDDSGTATAVWSEAGALMVVRRPEGGKFVEPQSLAASGVSEVSLDVASNGKAVIAFSGGMAGGELIVAVRNAATSDFGPPEVLVPEEDPSFVTDAEAKISESGRAVVVWTSDTTGQPTRIMAGLSDATGDFGATDVIADGANLQNPQVDVDATGRALAVWDHTEASAPNEIVAAAAGASGDFGPPAVVETLEQGPGAPDVAVNASGDAVLAHVDFTSEGEGVSRDKVEARYGSVDGTFGGFQNLTDPSTPTAASEVEVAIDDGGRAAVMSSLTVQGEHGVYVAVSDASGTFAPGSMQAVSPHDRVTGPGVPRRSYEIAAGGGEFSAFWINDHDEDGNNEVWTATSATGVFGAAHQLSPEDDDDSPDRAHGARNADGDVVAGWLLFGDALSAQVTPVASGPDPIFGDDGHDTLAGTNAGEAIYAAKGNDVVNAAGGDDDVFGEQGNDRLSGQGGGDELFGGSGRDTLIGGPGTDSFDGGGGRDTCVLSSKSERSRVQGCERVRVP
jgi:Ca2+-binding RTX toxin-like protein